MNDAEYIHHTDNFVRRGDIMLSIRNLSTVLLYRPSQNKVVWLKTGPFLNQHDIDYLGDGKFSIFGNDNVRFGDNRLVYESSAVYVYDMESDVVTRETDLTNADIAINSSGRLQVLSNGNYFIDDTKRALLVSPEGKVLLYYSHEVGTGKVGVMHWSRYLADISKIDFEKEK